MEISTNATATTPPPGEWRLLTLPPEIRTIIYELVTIKNERISITSRTPLQPPLLRVCSTVRQECLPLYYSRNRFTVLVNDYNVQPVLRPLRIHLKHYVPSPSDRNEHLGLCYGDLAILPVGRPSWKNLVGWCKAVYDGYGVNLKASGWCRGSGIYEVFVRLTDMIENGMKWEEIVGELPQIRRFLAIVDDFAWVDRDFPGSQ